MELWQLDFEWLRIQHFLKEFTQQEKLPDLQAVLFLIGIQELGLVQRSFTKEEKQDLMHIAVCTLLTGDGYFVFRGRDEDGWPHFDQLKTLPKQSVDEQETLLRNKIVTYFGQYIAKQD